MNLTKALIALLFFCSALSIAVSADNPSTPLPQSPTEDAITHDFVSEAEMKTDLLQMLADFTRYMTDNVADISDRNSDGDTMVSFIGENTFGNNEQGVRHNADMGMICAFLVKYGKDKATLPEGVTWEMLENLAKKSLVYSYSTHKANRLYPNKDNRYWGSSEGEGQWESSLWAMSVAYSAFFQWNKLSDIQKNHIMRLLESECDYELHRDIPTGYDGDSKAEENGWEADVLAAALGLFPDHEKAPLWFDRLREFAINSYSHPSDAKDSTIIDPEYDGKRVCDLYKGQNLFNDYTLQNHNLFHTSYQNVVMQELGEAALALRLFQNELHGKEKWKTNALMHNNRKVMDNVLYRLALADGELAMPNGNDWSLFLFDQITSYSTMACFLRDPHSLLLENLAYKNIKARQQTTPDGSWLLRPDVGARRMGVEGHRVMMTWLMHEVLPTSDIRPTTWPEFSEKFSETWFFPCQNIIRSSSPERFTTFSWSDGLKSYTGYLTSQKPDKNKIIVPFRANNTGNFIGWYDIEGKKTNATPIESGIRDIRDDSFVINGELATNDCTLDNRFAIYSGPRNAVIYLDNITTLEDADIKSENGGIMAISVDEFTRPSRRLHFAGCPQGMTSNGDSIVKIESGWLNIDGELGFVTPGASSMAFGDRRNNNSILTALLYSHYSDLPASHRKGERIGNRATIYYTGVDANQTEWLAENSTCLSGMLPEGWNGVVALEPDSSCSVLLSNFSGAKRAYVKGVTTPLGAPVLDVDTKIEDSASTFDVFLQHNRSYACSAQTYIKGDGILAIAEKDNPSSVFLDTDSSQPVVATITILTPQGKATGKVKLKPGKRVRATAENGRITIEDAPRPPLRR